MAQFAVIKRTDEAVVRRVDNTVKNKWQWSWVEKTCKINIAECLPEVGWKGGVLENNFSDFIRKVSYHQLRPTVDLTDCTVLG